MHVDVCTEDEFEARMLRMISLNYRIKLML